MAGRQGGGTWGAFGLAEFRAPWIAGFVSVLGDQLARVALSILVFQRTGSPALSAGTYALSMLPALLSGVLLSWLADRFPRRRVMVVADLVRAGLVAVMVVPVVPLPLLAGLLVLVQLAEAPFSAAQGAVLPELLGTRYEAGQAVQQVMNQLCLVLGFAVVRVRGRRRWCTYRAGDRRGHIRGVGAPDPGCAPLVCATVGGV